LKIYLGAAFEKKAFVLLLFFVFFRIEIALPQSNYSFKKIGTITWKRKGAIERPEVLTYKKTETEELVKKIEFKKRKLYQKEIQLVSKVIPLAGDKLKQSISLRA
jgi:hypothetical protein